MPDMMVSVEEMIMERMISPPNPIKVRNRVQKSNLSSIHITGPEGHTVSTPIRNHFTDESKE
jgi:hypothetical protein